MITVLRSHATNHEIEISDVDKHKCKITEVKWAVYMLDALSYCSSNKEY